MGANCSWLLYKESDSLLGIKKGKAVKNCQTHGENKKIFQANHSFLRAKEQKCDSLSKKEWITHITLCLRVICSCHSFVKSDKSDSLTFSRERIAHAHGRSLRRAILSKRVESERANSQPCPGYLFISNYQQIWFSLY